MIVLNAVVLGLETYPTITATWGDALLLLNEACFAVFVVDQGRARLRAVTIGARNGSEAWVQKGLDAGAKVIVYPPAAVVDGARVRRREV